MDSIAKFKENAKKQWSTFAALEMFTGTAAPPLVRFARISPGSEVLDVGCGTGVVALTAARMGARTTGVDLTVELLERARENAVIMGLESTFVEGDVEALPFPDGTFDVVVSQFGHIFAPRPELATAEMLRVLKPGGVIALSTWPPELYTGRFLALVGRYAPAPAPPEFAPPRWGDPAYVRERLGASVRDLAFDRGEMRIPVLSVQHALLFNEQGVGPFAQVARALEVDDPKRLLELRRELEALIALYFEDNQLRQSYLLSRAIKV